MRCHREREDGEVMQKPDTKDAVQKPELFFYSILKQLNSETTNACATQPRT